MVSQIRELFLSDPDISEAVNDQIYVVTAPQGTPYPFIVITLTSGDAYGTLGGTTGLQSSEIDVDCISDDAHEASAVAFIVRDFFKDYVGLAGITDADVEIKAVNVLDEQQSTVPLPHAADTYAFTSLVEYQVQWEV